MLLDSLFLALPGTGIPEPFRERIVVDFELGDLEEEK